MLVEILRTIQWQEVIIFYDEFLFETTSRRKFSSQFWGAETSTEHHASAAITSAHHVVIEDHALFKRGMSTSPVSFFFASI
jgi:hypothetical protein